MCWQIIGDGEAGDGSMSLRERERDEDEIMVEGSLGVSGSAWSKKERECGPGGILRFLAKRG